MKDIPSVNVSTPAKRRRFSFGDFIFWTFILWTNNLAPSIDHQAALQRYMALTAIPGISGEEHDVADAIIAELRQAGIADSQWCFDDAGEKTVPPGRVGNLIVNLPGTIDADAPRTMLSAHMDTVPICVGAKPVREGDEIVSANPESGLGADDRSGCAAILTAIVERMKRGGDGPPAVVTFLVQEEIGLRGARHLKREQVGRVDRAFNFDGGAPEKMTVGAIGGERMDIVVRGIPAHAGVAPQEGVSAITIAALAIADLYQNGWLGRVEKGEHFGTSNVGVFAGGEATNVITPEAKLRAEARSHDGEFRKRIVQEIGAAFSRAARAVRNSADQCGGVEFSSHVDYEAFRLPEDHPSIEAASKAIAITGRHPRAEIGNGGLDANWLFRHGIQAVTMGSGQHNIHTADERLDINEYLDACRIATFLIS